MSKLTEKGGQIPTKPKPLKELLLNVSEDVIIYEIMKYISIKPRKLRFGKEKLSWKNLFVGKFPKGYEQVELFRTIEYDRVLIMQPDFSFMEMINGEAISVLIPSKVNSLKIRVDVLSITPNMQNPEFLEWTKNVKKLDITFNCSHGPYISNFPLMPMLEELTAEAIYQRKDVLIVSQRFDVSNIFKGTKLKILKLVNLAVHMYCRLDEFKKQFKQHNMQVFEVSGLRFDSGDTVDEYFYVDREMFYNAMLQSSSLKTFRVDDFDEKKLYLSFEQPSLEEITIHTDSSVLSVNVSKKVSMLKKLKIVCKKLKFRKDVFARKHSKLEILQVWCTELTISTLVFSKYKGHGYYVMDAAKNFPNVSLFSFRVINTKYPIEFTVTKKVKTVVLQWGSIVNIRHITDTPLEVTAIAIKSYGHMTIGKNVIHNLKKLTKLNLTSPKIDFGSEFKTNITWYTDDFSMEYITLDKPDAHKMDISKLFPEVKRIILDTPDQNWAIYMTPCVEFIQVRHNFAIIDMTKDNAISKLNLIVHGEQTKFRYIENNEIATRQFSRNTKISIKRDSYKPKPIYELLDDIEDKTYTNPLFGWSN